MIQREDGTAHPSPRTDMNVTLGWCLGLSHTVFSKTAELHFWGILVPGISFLNMNPATRCVEIFRDLGLLMFNSR